MKRKSILIILFILAIFTIILPTKIVRANDLSQNINDQLENLDLSELEEFYNNLNKNDIYQISLKDKLLSLLNGEYISDYNSIIEIITSNISEQIKHYLPIILSIIAICLLCNLTQNIKSNYLSESTTSVINLVCSITITLIIYKELVNIYTICKTTIENIAILNEIMSPIILTLMLAIGSNASASVYSPQTMLLSGIISNVFLKIIIPLVVIMTIINTVGDLSNTKKLSSFTEFITSLIKWVIGISFAIFTLFITTQGLTSSTFDSASIRATKYAISNSIPLVGGFLKDGFDLMIAGSVLIKNALGLVSIITMLSFIFSPLIKMTTFSILIKLSDAIINIFSSQNTSYLKNTAKCISYFNISTIICGFMYFLTILLTILTANAFI